ncbi:Uu.00g107890.m01.CDS01 [Anthostomella pinea]|uniref:Uu.00g107890.m01.CDS01 n=1 Tax=Anthostomella pinea TaxID=933095 RepID=A0AAI8V9A5_9PEZI|nr:Uu.00g107890.m01.CDS01 [Anthostomella pinea]
MGLYTELPQDVQEVDVIIAGGGTAGCIVAARLADADPDLSVLVIEEGTNNLGNPMISKPAFCYTHALPGGQTTRLYKGIKEPNIAGREIHVHSGAILRGGSAINMMMYTRGQRSDYDAWQTPGWSADDMLHYLKKFEIYHGLGQQAYHGDDGPIHVSDGDPTSVPVGQYIAVSSFTVYPYSRGHIHISGPLLDDEPEFASGFFSDTAGLDIKKHVWAYKAQREIIRRMACYRAPPSPEATRRIAYTAEDDAVLEKWLRENVNTTWHSLGTCRMGARAEMGVVDPGRGVYGVSGLKIADMSIALQNVAANTASTAMAIGEKAADLFIRELGLAKH